MQFFNFKFKLIKMKQKLNQTSGENSLYLFSIGIHDIKDGRVSIVLESTKGIKDIGLLSEDEMFVVFSERKVVKYYIESSTINY